MLKFGDQSCHNSEIWAMKFNDIEYVFADAIAAGCHEPPGATQGCNSTPPWSCSLNAPRDKGPIPILAGQSYPIQMVWKSTAFNNGNPDYDWTCFVDACDESGGNRQPLMAFHANGPGFGDDDWLPMPPANGFFIDDPGRLMGERFSGSLGDFTATAMLKPVVVDIAMDADRNGSIDAQPNGPDEEDEDVWEYGTTAKGAVILVNSDDDDVDHEPDAFDSAVNGAADVNDLTRLVIRRLDVDLPQGSTVELKVSSSGDKVRVFNSRTATATAVIEPNTPDRAYEVPLADIEGQGAALEYGIEAIQYSGWPDQAFDGLVTLELTFSDAQGTTIGVDTIECRVAPWMMSSHLDPVTAVYVADTFPARPTSPAGAAAAFPSRLNNALMGTNFTPIIITSGDGWIQDQYEFGFQAAPNGTWNTVLLNSPRDLGGPILASYAQTVLLRPGLGLYGTSLDNSDWTTLPDTYDSFGNLECFPPLGQWSSGVIYHGNQAPTGMQDDLTTFFNEQNVQGQPPAQFFSSWLAVGHIDEFISIQATGSNTFRAIVANTDIGIDELEIAAAGGHVFDHGELWDEFEVLSADSLLNDLNRRQFNGFIQDELNEVVIQLVDMGIDVVWVPAYFEGVESNGTPGYQLGERCFSALPNMVNMLNVNGTMIVPDPKFIPFKTAFDAAVGQPVWIDCMEYHWGGGAVHCGTNVIREPRPQIKTWWMIEP